jgi:serine/threonine protein kinase
METTSEIISRALFLATIAEGMKTIIRERIQSLTIERKIAFAIKLKELNENRSKINGALEHFLAETGSHTPFLRSGSIRKLTHGEHRVLSVGEDIPFEVSLDPARQGGPSTVRKALCGNIIMALKIFHTNVNEESFKREVSILKELDHSHVCSALASLQDQGTKFLILLKPSCDVRAPIKNCI